MSHVENSRLVEFSFGAESMFKLFNMFITSMYELNLSTSKINIGLFNNANAFWNIIYKLGFSGYFR